MIVVDIAYMHTQRIQALLAKHEVRDQIDQGHRAPTGVLGDFCDGEFIKNHPLVTANPESLMLAFYFDDLETANPLGSRRGKHKLGRLTFMSSFHTVVYNGFSVQGCSIGLF